MRGFIAFLLSLLIAGAAAAASPEEAAKLFEQQKWQEAADAYQGIVEREPTNALALIRLARSRAASGDSTAALAALEAWFATASGSYAVAMTLPEFKPLHAHPGFLAIVEPRRPCRSAEYRQFDFWLGDWNVESPTSPGGVGHNRITGINGGCTLREVYTTSVGYEGTSLSFYDAARKIWHQTWIDNQGGALYLEGGMQGESMVLASTADPQNIHRISWAPLPDGRVRQHWQTTADGGRTWATAFDGYYSRRAAE